MCRNTVKYIYNRYSSLFLHKKGLIILIETERDFGKACLAHGFARLARRLYARCIGDGIYQTIYTGFRDYISTDSPNYSNENRKDYYISIGIRSLYSSLLEDAFADNRGIGGYRPGDLLHKCKYSGQFNGIEEEYSFMEQGGFDVLDSVNSQEEILELWDAIQTTADGNRIHDPILVEPLLLCRRKNEAEYEISTNIVQSTDAYMSYMDRVECGYLAKDSAYETRYWDKMRRQLNLWKLIARDRHDGLDHYISENYSRNLSWAKQYGIPTDMLSSPRALERM